MLDDFFEALDPAILVATADDGRERDGCVVGFATQCSIHPLRLVVCLSVANRTYAVARNAASMAVHLLGTEQRPVASLFGEHSGDELDKLARLTWRPGETGAPLLEDCSAWLEGWVEARIPLGDHVGYLINPIAGGRGPRHGRLALGGVADLVAAHSADERPSTRR